MKHILKTDPAVFQAVADGAKTYEIRLNDRGFAVGDELLLRETTHTGAEIALGSALEYTGREITKHIGHVLGGYGLKDGWVILSFAERTTSPVSQIADETIIQIARRELRSEGNLFEGDADEVAVFVRECLDAAAPHAQASAAQQESIDSSQYFGKLLSRVAEFGFNGGHEKALIECIDQHTAAAVAKARKEMRSTVSESIKLMADACSRANRAEQRAAIAASQPSKLPPPELTWLYTHCRAIGMDCKSSSGKWEEDIGLWTVNLTNEIKALRANQQAAEPVARMVKYVQQRGRKGTITAYMPFDTELTNVARIIEDVPLYAAQATQRPQVKPNADCSGDPKSCPDNEGYGCSCDPMNKAVSANTANCQDNDGEKR